MLPSLAWGVWPARAGLEETMAKQVVVYTQPG
jgi:hypothetical protein